MSIFFVGTNETVRYIWLSVLGLWDVKESTPLFEKSRDVDPVGVASFSWAAGRLSIRGDVNIGITS